MLILEHKNSSKVVVYTSTSKNPRAIKKNDSTSNLVKYNHKNKKNNQQNIKLIIVPWKDF